MDPVLPEFTDFLSRLTLREPQIPLLSNVTGTWMTADEATDPATWARQIRSTVRFSDELDAVADESAPGPRRGRSRRQPDRIGDAPPEVVGRAPRRSAHAPPGPEPRRPRHLPARARAALVGRRRRRLDAPARRSPAAACLAARLSLCAATALGRPQRRRTVGGRCCRAPNGDRHRAVERGCRPGPGRRQRQSPIEATLQRIWAQCLGVDSVDRNANFFELGGDSLVAISVAMTASQEGSGPHAAGSVRPPDRGRARPRPSSPGTRPAGWRASRRVTWYIRRFRRTSRTSSRTGSARPVAGASR